MTDAAEEILSKITNSDEMKTDINELQHLRKSCSDALHDLEEAKKNVFATENKVAKILTQQKNAIKRIRPFVDRLEKIGEIESIDAIEYRETLATVQDEVKQNAKLLQQNAKSWWINAVAGPLPLLLGSRKDRFAYKQHYEEFKRDYSLLVLVNLVILYFFRHRFFTFTLHLLLLFFYIAQTTRENILVLNGSRIGRWWRLHHYFSVLLSIFMMAWPYTRSYVEFIPNMLNYGIFNCVVVLLQYRYQTSRLYTARAMGRTGSMEPVEVETASRGHWFENTTLLLLLPFVVLGQILQIYTAYALYKLNKSYGESQIMPCAILFLLLGVGNILSTARAIVMKIGHRKKRE